MSKILRGIFVALSLAVALVPFASAREVFYAISIDWTSGPLGGSKSRGLVSFDDALALPGAEYTASNLISRFHFRVGHQRYNLSSVVSGYLSFDATAQLRLFLFGTSCGPGYCSSQPGDPNSLYFVYDSESQLDRFFAVQGPPEEGLQSYGVGTLRLIRPRSDHRSEELELE